MGHPNGYQPYGRNVKNNASMNITQDEEVIYLSLEEATKVWLSLQVKEGKISAADADKLWNSAKSGWSGDGKVAAKAIADYFSPVQDLGLAIVVAKDLGRYVGKARIQNYRGVPYVIFKGNARSRQILTGTRYSLGNAKIVSLGIGKEGVRSAARKGGILSIVLVSAFNVIDFILNDKTTLSVFVASMAVDIGIVVASTAVGLAVGAAAAGVTLIAGLAVGPLLVVVGVTVLVSIGLGYLADKFQIKQKISAALDEAYDYKVAQLKGAKKKVENKVISITANIIEALAQRAANEFASRLSRAVKRRFGPIDWIQF